MEEEDRAGVAYASVQALAARLNCQSTGSDWIIDTGAFDHMTCDPHIFTNFFPYCSENVIINANGVKSVGTKCV